VAHTLAQAGARVMLCSRKIEGVQPVADSINAAGGTALAMACHTGQRAQVQALVERTVAEWGRLDIVVNNAATNPHFGPMIDSEESQWDKTYEVNVKGYFWLAQAAVPHMERVGGGSIINVASVAGLHPGTAMGIYSVSKAAVIAMTKQLAQELGHRNIRVNAIAPGVIKTRFSSALWGNEQIHETVVGNTPLGRIGTPDEVTGAVLYLASPAVRVFLDGGWSNPRPRFVFRYPAPAPARPGYRRTSAPATPGPRAGAPAACGGRM
jgi:NAD(P)-dependent dehydrogenase (short-subunit alcohol dehydrogenase family)